MMGATQKLEALYAAEDKMIQRLEELAVALENSRRLHRMLLKNVGDRGPCHYCTYEVIWVRHKNGVFTPYDRDGETHLSKCPNFPKKASTGNG
jgi:hypothetical protein